MKGIVTVISICLLFLAGCEKEKSVSSDAKSKQSNEKQQPQTVKNNEPPKSLRELKKGEFVSSRMLPLSELYPETNEDIYVHVKGLVVNLNEQETWAVVKDGDSYYFAFGHANEPMIKKYFLGKEVYIQALVDERLLKESSILHTQNKGLAPGNVPDSLVREYQLNVIKIAATENISKEEFMGLKK